MHSWSTNKRVKTRQKPAKKINFLRVSYALFWMFVGLTFAYLITTKTSVNISFYKNILPIENVNIRTELTNEKVAKVKAIFEGVDNKNYFGIDIEKIQNDILKMPWVDKVIVSKVWPKSLNINIVEAKPIAQWKNKYVSIRGKIFDTDNDVKNLPVFIGEEKMIKNLISHYVNLQHEYMKYDLSIDEVKIDTRGSLEILLNDSNRVLLGSVNINNKNALALQVVKEKKMVGTRIDMRYENGFSLENNSEIY